jgi:hypothetical protein
MRYIFIALKFIFITLKKRAKKNGVPDQGTPSNSHATTTSVAAPQGAEFII